MYVGGDVGGEPAVPGRGRRHRRKSTHPKQLDEEAKVAETVDADMINKEKNHSLVNKAAARAVHRQEVDPPKSKYMPPLPPPPLPPPPQPWVLKQQPNECEADHDHHPHKKMRYSGIGDQHYGNGDPDPESLTDNSEDEEPDVGDSQRIGKHYVKKRPLAFPWQSSPPHPILSHKWVRKPTEPMGPPSKHHYEQQGITADGDADDDSEESTSTQPASSSTMQQPPQAKARPLRAVPLPDRSRHGTNTTLFE
jgi:hypothetical protein